MPSQISDSKKPLSIFTLTSRLIVYAYYIDYHCHLFLYFLFIFLTKYPHLLLISINCILCDCDNYINILDDACKALFLPFQLGHYQ